MYGRLIAERDVDCCLVNTGWTGGAYPAGERIKIAYSRALVRAAMEGLGVALAPLMLSRPMLEQGKLVPLLQLRQRQPLRLQQRLRWRAKARCNCSSRPIAGLK